MRIYTQAELDDLINCDKSVTRKPRREMLVQRGYRRNDMSLKADDGRAFEVFMRQNDTLEEDFSIGLRYVSSEDGAEILVMRCNGNHGIHTNKVRNRAVIRGGPHIHYATPEAMQQGIYSENYAESTTDYYDYPEALRYFLQRVRVHNWTDCLPAAQAVTLSLFPEESNSIGDQ